MSDGRAAILIMILCTLSCSSMPMRSPLPDTFEMKREDGSTIHYYLKSSLGGSSDTLLIVLQGSDCNSVKYDPFIQQHAKAVWPSADLLLIEKRGINDGLFHNADAERPDCPAEYILNDSPQQRIQDIRMVVDRLLQAQSYHKIIALGGSEGAVVAAMYAAETGIPTAVVLINSGGRYFLDDVLHNIKVTTPAESVEAELNGFNGFVGHVLASEPFDMEVSNHGYLWWRNVLSIDQQSVLSAIDAPILIAQSGRDQSVSPDAVGEMIDNLRAAGKTNIEFMIYPDLDHGLKNVSRVYRTDQVVNDINFWLRSTLINP